MRLNHLSPCTMAWSAGLAVAVALLVTRADAHPEAPGAPQDRPIAIVGATLHVVSGPPVQATLLLEEGKIAAIGKNAKPPEGAVVIDAQGKHVYPGLMDSMSNMGLVEINAVRATRDERETGQLNPNVRAQTAVNPDSELIPVTRSNGVLLTVVTPSGGLISGRSAVLQLDGWTWEDMTLRGDAALQVNWPSIDPPSKDQHGEATVPDGLATLEETVDAAEDYRRAREADPTLHRDIRLESLLPVLDGEIPLCVAADDLLQIRSAVAFCQRHSLRLIIHGGYDAPLCAELLKERKVPVIVGSVHRLPLRRSDPYDTPFTVAERLRQAGVQYCVAGEGRFGASNVRNLPYHAATAAAYGLPKDEALRAITLYPAQIFGVDDRIGSLQQGKDATLFIADGDILETPTQVERAWIQGREVSLNDRHKRLYSKYRQKYEQR